jgi:serine/threonine protein phosphatase PrpC
VANAGDTRCVLWKKDAVKRISTDHKPDLPEEKEFIEENGGFVENNSVNGMLAVSRCLGDGFIGSVIRATPDVSTHKIDHKCKIIVACDGIWDVISDQVAFDIVNSSDNPLSAAEALRTAALREASQDNLSVVVVFIDKEGPLCKHCAIRWVNDVPRNRRED